MLRIGVIGYSPNVTKKHVIPFLRELEEGRILDRPKAVSQRIISMNPEKLLVEDCEYIFFIREPDRYAGMLIDQLIICDDSRWMIYNQQCEIINHAKYMLKRSCVPEEFQVIELQLF